MATGEALNHIRQVANILTNPAQIHCPISQQWHVPFGLVAQHNIAIKQTDSLIYKQGLCARKAIHGCGRHGTDAVLFQERAEVPLERANHSGLVLLCDVGILTAESEAVQDAVRHVVSIQIPMEERRLVLACVFGVEVLQDVIDIVSFSTRIVEMPRLKTFLMNGSAR